MSEVNLNDEKFDRGSNWTHFYKDERFDQRFLIEGDAFFAETLMTVRSSRDAALSMLRGSWNWWDHGSSLGFRSNSDMSCEMDLKPVAWFTTRFHLYMFPPVALSDLDGIRLPARFTGHFEGPGSYDVYSKSKSENTVVIRARFHGVKNKVPFGPMRMVIGIHLRAEAGNLFFPFPKGTGFCGLYRRLEGKLQQ